MASRQSHRAYNTPPLSPSTSIFPSDPDRNTLLSGSDKVILSSLESLNDYVQRHYDRFVESESANRVLLAASYAEKEKSYKRQIATLKTIHVDLAGLIAREQATNVELRQKLNDTTNSMARLCEVVTDANLVFVDRKRAPHEVKLEEGSQESMDISDVVLCPDAAISALLSQIEAVFTEMDGRGDVGLPPPVDPSPCYSIIRALEKVVDSLLATQRTFALLQENFKSVDAARADAERQNECLQEKVALLQEELKQARSDGERISRELVAARLEREEHVCRLPTPACPTPAVQDEFPASLPSPPLEKLDLPIPDDVLQETCKISRKTNQALPKRVLPVNTPPSPKTPAVEVGPSSASTSTSCGRRTMSLSDAVKRVQANSTSSITQSGPSKSPIIRNDQQTARPSIPPPSAPAQGIKRTSSGAHKCQGVSQGPPSSLSTSASTISSMSDKTSSPHTQKKRRINGTSDTTAVNQKHKPPNETPSKTAITAHTSTSTTGPPPASTSNHPALPKTQASDLKSLKFNKKSQPSKPPPSPTTATSANRQGPVATPKKSDRQSMRPLDLAKKSPQERAAMRRSK